MVGRELGDGDAPVERSAGEPVLEVDDVWTQGDRGGDAVRGVSLTVRAGEIVAVAGVAGNGQRELAETIAGLRAPSRGRVRVSGKALRPGDPRSAIAAGIAYVPEDRMGTGVAPSLSIAANLVLKSYRLGHVSRGPLLRLRHIRDRAVELISHYRIAAPGPTVPARLLSGGNLQKVVLAREFSGRPRVLVAASPTRGLDVGAIEAVQAYLREAAGEGIAVLLLSEDLDEILSLADRIAVMYEGAVLGELPSRGADVEEIGLLMAGGHDPRSD
jgi:general nucleoside transport system ATP-binding protein